MTRRVSSRLRDLLWSRYTEAFELLDGRAIVPQVLPKEEFDALVDNVQTYKFLGYEAGEPAGMILLVDRLDLVPGISEAFLAARYPDEVARQTLFYGVFAFVAPGSARLRLYASMLSAAAQLAASKDGVIILDMSRQLEQAGQVRLIERSVRGFPGVEVAEVDAQLYYAVRLPEPTQRTTGFLPDEIDVLVDLTDDGPEPRAVHDPAPVSSARHPSAAEH